MNVRYKTIELDNVSNGGEKQVTPCVFNSLEISPKGDRGVDSSPNLYKQKIYWRS